jgi:hypothetical protein
MSPDVPLQATDVGSSPVTTCSDSSRTSRRGNSDARHPGPRGVLAGGLRGDGDDCYVGRGWRYWFAS